MTESADFLKIYQKFRDYFVEELGYKPFREDPDSILLINFKNSEISKKNLKQLSDFQVGAFWTEIDYNLSLFINEEDNLIEEIIARECLLSFLPIEIRNYPLMYFYIYRRLSFGKNPLLVLSKNKLKKYYNKIEPTLLSELLKDEYARIDYRIIDKRLPKDKIEEYFKRYFYSFSNLKQLFSKIENNSEIISSVEDDYYYSFIFDRFYNNSEINLLKFFLKKFYRINNSISLEDFKNLLIQNKNLPAEKKDNSLVFFEDIKNFAKIDKLYQSLEERLVSYNYRINYTPIKIENFFFFIRIGLNSNIEILDYSLKNLSSIIYFQDNISQKETIKMGLIIVAANNENLIIQFLNNLKNYNLIEEFALMKIKSIKSFMDLRFLNIFRKGKEDLIEFEINYQNTKNKIGYKLDYIDIVLIKLLRFVNFGFGLKTGYERNKHFIGELNKELDNISSKIKNIEILLKSTKSNEINEPIIHFLNPEWNLNSNFNQKMRLVEFVNRIIKEKWYFPTKLFFESNFIAYSFLEKMNFKEITNNNSILNNSVFNNLAEISGKIFFKTDIRNWLSKIIDILKNDKELLKRIKETIKLIIKFMEIYRKFPNGDEKAYINNLSSNYKVIQDYVFQDRNEIEKDLKNRIERLKKLKIIKPNIINSIFLPHIYSKRHLILKNIGPSSKKIEEFSKLLPYLEIIKLISPDLKETVIIIFYISPYLVKTISSVIQTLFREEMIFYGNFYGEFYLPDFELTDYDMNSGENEIQKKEFSEMLRYIKNFKENANSNNSKDETLFNFNNHSKTDNKSINTLLRQVDNIYIQNSKETKEYLEFLRNKQNIVQEILNLERIFKNIPEKFASLQNSLKYISKIIPLPIYEKFNLDKYIVQVKINQKKFSTNEYGMINTGEFLLCPGFEKVQSSADLGYFETYFIDYIFPKDDPNENILKYAYSRKVLDFYRVIKIKRKYISFAPTFHLSFDDWNSTYRTWEIFVHKIMVGRVLEYMPHHIVYNFINDSDILFPKDSPEFSELVKIYDNDFIKLMNLNSGGSIRHLIESDCIKLSSTISFLKIGLVNKHYIFLANTNKMQEEMIMKIFSTLPYSEIDEIEYFESESLIKINKYVPNGLFINLYLPNSRIEQFYNVFLGICKNLEISEFQIIPDIIDTNISDFTDGKIRKKVHPLKSHIWNSKSKKWNRIKYFDEKGIPFPHKERIKLLNSL